MSEATRTSPLTSDAPLESFCFPPFFAAAAKRAQTPWPQSLLSFPDRRDLSFSLSCPLSESTPLELLWKEGSGEIERLRFRISVFSPRGFFVASSALSVAGLAPLHPPPPHPTHPHPPTHTHTHHHPFLLQCSAPFCCLSRRDLVQAQSRRSRDGAFLVRSYRLYVRFHETLMFFLWGRGCRNLYRFATNLLFSLHFPSLSLSIVPIPMTLVFAPRSPCPFTELGRFEGRNHAPRRKGMMALRPRGGGGIPSLSQPFHLAIPIPAPAPPRTPPHSLSLSLSLSPSSSKSLPCQRIEGDEILVPRGKEFLIHEVERKPRSKKTSFGRSPPLPPLFFFFPFSYCRGILS